MPNQDAGSCVSVIVVEVDGAVRRETWTNEGSLLTALQRAVGGNVDCRCLRSGMDMWVHDEGLYHLPVNPFATAIAMAAGARQPFYGPAVFTGGPDDSGDGNTTSLAESHAEAIKAVAADLLRMPAAVSLLRKVGDEFAAAYR